RSRGLVWRRRSAGRKNKKPASVPPHPPSHISPSPAADRIKQTESRFTDNHEPFFNTIDPKRTCRVLKSRSAAVSYNALSFAVGPPARRQFRTIQVWPKDLPAPL